MISPSPYAPFAARGVLMRLDDGGIDHLHAGVAIR
jgi:hypothetical protein